MKGISVIICCYNSTSRIEETVEYLYRQKVRPDIFWEIIIVNNASTDNTVEVVENCKKRHTGGVTFKLIEETTPGLIHARKKGIEAAKFDVLIFCDDDNHLDINYVETGYDLMEKHPEVAIAGGWVKPKLPFYPGKWIEGNYAALAIDPEAKDEGYVKWVFGAGMIFRKKIFSELKDRGIAFMLTGRLGTKQTSGDDAEMCYLARLIGYQVYYSPSLVLHHKIAASRLTRWSFVKANYKNIYHTVFFFAMDKLIQQPTLGANKLYFNFLRTRSYNLLFFFPRIFIGKYNFYSFMMFFQNLQILGWLLVRRKNFGQLTQQIWNNLYAGRS